MIFCLPSLAFGVDAAISNIPGTISPARVQEHLPEAPVSPTKPSVPKLAEAEGIEKAPAGAEKILFVLNKVNITGNTAFTTTELESIFSPSYHKKISLADVQEMVNKITKKYREKGYVLSRAILPAQHIVNGMVKVEVIEGYISKIEVKGKIGRLRILIDRMSCQIRCSRPFRIGDLERVMLVINDIPGLAVQAVITPSKDIPASADLILASTRKYTNAYVAYDNYGTRYLGPQEFTAGANFYSVFMPGDNNVIRWSGTTQGSEMHYYEYDYSFPLGFQGARFLFGSNFTITQPGFVLEPLLIRGRNLTTFTGVSYPIIRSRAKNLYFTSTFNFQNVYSTILHQLFYNDLIRSVTLDLAFDTVDHWQGTDTIDVSVEKGMDILGAQKHFNQSRLFGVPDFTKMNVYASRLKYYNARFSVYTAFRGQYSCNPLLSAKQFGYGGPDFGRGYDPSEILGDSGVAGKLELRFDTRPEKKLLNFIQYYMFYDAGLVWNRDVITQLPKQSATSVGGGLRITFIPQVTANLYIAKPLTHNVAVLQLQGEDAQAWRGFFQFIVSI